MEPPFKFDDPRQERIYRRLIALVGQGPADFFKDACRMMADSASLATTSHLVSHSLREVESALRAVLETVSEREARLSGKDSGDGHENGIRGILRGLQIPESDPIAVAWLGLAGKGNSYGLATRAHRYALGSSRPVDGDFLQFWNEMQGIFDVVLDKFETSYLAVYSFLDQLLEKAVPTQGDIDKLRNNVSNNLVAHSYFFERLMSPDWLDLLQKNGFFSHPPAAEVDKEKGTIGYAAWPQSRYLIRMASKAPEKVLNIMLAVPSTDNFRVYEDFASAAALMPPELAAKWSEREALRINKPEGLWGLLPEKLGALMNHLLRGDQIPAALNLARSLLDILPDIRPERQEQKKDEYSLPPEPRARFSAWEYKRILERMIPLLSPAARIQTFDLFSDLLEKAITLSRHPSEGEQGGEDYSYIWHPHIEDRPRGDHLKNILVPAVHDLALVIAGDDPNQVPQLVKKLEARPYEVFHRVALDLLRRHPDGTLIAERLTNRRLFDARGTRHEYELLAQERFGKLSVEDQRKIFAWIAAGPDDDETYKRWHKQWSGQEATDVDVVRHRKRWQRDHLAPLQKSLSIDWKKKYEQLIGEVGKPEGDVTENPRVEVSRGPLTPLNAADFESMSVDEIVEYLGSWKPTPGPMSPSRHGLGRELAEIVHKAPIRFAPEVAKFQRLDPTYVRSLLEGIRQGINAVEGLPWAGVLDLCNWVVQQPIVIKGRQVVDRFNDDPDWGYTRKTIAGLLGAGLDEGPSTIPFELRGEVWRILEILTNDPDPTPDDEDTGDEPFDPSHLAINSTRGEAMQVVVRYALWVRHYLQKLPDGAEKIARGFEEMPEVRRVLEAHLNLAQDPSLAIRSVYGRWLPSLTYLDAEWTKNHIKAIFPSEAAQRRFRDAAWDTYIVFCPPYGPVLDVLHEEYRAAIERVGMPATTRLANNSATATELAGHLMVFYWHGNLPLEDATGLLARFFEKATDALRGEALEFLGRNVDRPDEALPEEYSLRLKKLWETRLATIIASGTPTEHAAELASFGWWFASGKLDDAWAVPQLLIALSLVRKTGADYQVVERLVTIAESMPLEAVQCLALMIEGDEEGWELRTWRDDSRKILAVALASSSPAAKQAAIALVNRLAARGMPDYRDLLSA